MNARPDMTSREADDDDDDGRSDWDSEPTWLVVSKSTALCPFKMKKKSSLDSFARNFLILKP